MRIGFDGKRIFQNYTGLGNYSRTILYNLLQLAPENQYRIFAHEKYLKNSIFNHSVYRENTFFAQNGNSSAWRSKGIVKDLIKENIQIYHGLSNELPIGLPKNIKSVLTIHDLIFLKHPKLYPFIDRQVYKAKAKSACKNADMIVAVSESTKNDVVELLKIPEEKIKVVYPSWGREFEHQYTFEVNEIRRRKLRLPENFLLYVGSITKRKNLLAVLEALVLPENEEIPLVVVGNGDSYEKKVREFIAKNKMQHRIFFFQDIIWYDLPGIFALATGLIYPSTYEGFGLPVLEAQKMGIPVITSNNSSLKEAGGGGCFFIDPKDSAQIGHSINILFNNCEDLDERREINFSFIKKFEPLQVTKQMVSIYGSLV